MSTGDLVEHLGVDGSHLEATATLEEAADAVVGAQTHVDGLRDVVEVGVELQHLRRSSPSPE